MPLPPSPWISRLLAGQCVAIALIFLALPFAPPAAGRLLLVPISGQSAARLASDALAGGARLIDRGPVAGSLVVEGDHGRLAAALGAVLIIAAPQSGCGRPGETA
jgi:hypothetical protein